jgi:hypothetical protein
LAFISLMVAVARLLSSQNPGDAERCLSSSIFMVRLATSKKPPQDEQAIPHIFYIFCCHGGKDKEVNGNTEGPLAKRVGYFETTPDSGSGYTTFEPDGHKDT